MKYDIAGLINDIITSIDLINKYIHKINYEKELRKDAVERRLGIIKEALNKMSKKYPDVFNKITNSDIEKIRVSDLFLEKNNNLILLKKEVILLQNNIKSLNKGNLENAR